MRLLRVAVRGVDERAAYGSATRLDQRDAGLGSPECGPRDGCRARTPQPWPSRRVPVSPAAHGAGSRHSHRTRRQSVASCALASSLSVASAAGAMPGRPKRGHAEHGGRCGHALIPLSGRRAPRSPCDRRRSRWRHANRKRAAECPAVRGGFRSGARACDDRRVRLSEELRDAMRGRFAWRARLELAMPARRRYAAVDRLSHNETHRWTDPPGRAAQRVLPTAIPDSELALAQAVGATAAAGLEAPWSWVRQSGPGAWRVPVDDAARPCRRTWGAAVAVPGSRHRNPLARVDTRAGGLIQ